MNLYTVENVQQVYGGRRVLNLPELSITPGEILGLVGPSGAGKSTLLRLLGLLEAPTYGRVEISLAGRGVHFQTATVDDRRRIVMVFQRPVLLSRTVQENVAYGLRLRGQRDGRQRVEEVLRRVSMQHLARAKPQTLSGGEMQRVAIARALILQPDVLLLDEPTANLDPYNVSLIESFLLAEHQRYRPTIVVITHNVLQARRLATRVALLLDGEIVETAPTDCFFDSPRDPRTQAFLSGRLVY